MVYFIEKQIETQLIALTEYFDDFSFEVDFTKCQQHRVVVK